MKPLKKFLNPKSQWHGDTFPKTLDLKATIKFLKANRFTQLRDPNYPEYIDYVNKFINRLKISYAFYIYDTTEPGLHRLYFYNGGEISKDNPLVVMTTTSLKIFYTDSEESSSIHKYDFISPDYDLFLEKIYEIFGWK